MRGSHRRLLILLILTQLVLMVAMVAIFRLFAVGETKFPLLYREVPNASHGPSQRTGVCGTFAMPAVAEGGSQLSVL